MKNLVTTTLLSLVAASAEAGALFTPETSRLFERQVEPLSGHAYYQLRPVAGKHSRQSLYFTAKSMTDDGRFLMFWGYDEPEDGQGIGMKSTYVIDFAVDRVVKVPIPAQIPFIDVKTDQVLYFRRDPSGDFRKDAVCRLDLKSSLTNEIFVCNVPEALVKGVKTVHYYSTHPTLTRDRRKMFIAAHLDDRYVQGCINLVTGAWESWGGTPFFANHDQLCPADDNLALIAWEACARTEDALAYREKTGWYPRMWLCRPDGSRELQPSKLPDHNYATHEHWTEDGTGFYWCHACVLLQDLATGRQSEIVPWKAAHAAMTADNRYVAFDYAVGKWYRGCQWQVGFWNRETGRGTYVFPYRPALCSDTPGSKRHPDPHPQFVCNDRYVVCTINSADGHMDLAVVPVGQLVARTAVDPMSFFADLPAEAQPAHVSKRLAEHFLECPADDYHAPDVPYVWGRGAGWMAAGMALVLRHTPPQNEDYHKVLGGYRRMMSALLKCQRADGLWGQLVNEPSSWAETSGSAMFAFAFVEGVRKGWLEPETYGPAARKAYLALVGKLDEYANLKDVCIGTGKRNDHQCCQDRPREAGDPHGLAALSWICGALLRSE